MSGPSEDAVLAGPWVLRAHAAGSRHREREHGLQAQIPIPIPIPPMRNRPPD